MNGPPDELLLARQWVEKAEHDLTNAEYALTLPEDRCPFDTVCFHAQQCAEKYLKALLVFRSVDFPKTHDLVVLFNLLERAGMPVDIRVSEMQPLNRYPIEVRYPGDWEIITRNEAEEAVAIARKVREAVRGRLPKQALSPG